MLFWLLWKKTTEQLYFEKLKEELNNRGYKIDNYNRDCTKIGITFYNWIEVEIRFNWISSSVSGIDITYYLTPKETVFYETYTRSIAYRIRNEVLSEIKTKKEKTRIEQEKIEQEVIYKKYQELLKLKPLDSDLEKSFRKAERIISLWKEANKIYKEIMKLKEN